MTLSSILLYSASCKYIKLLFIFDPQKLIPLFKQGPAGEITFRENVANKIIKFQ